MASDSQYAGKDEKLAEISVAPTTPTQSEPDRDSIALGAEIQRRGSLIHQFSRRQPWLMRHIGVTAPLLALVVALVTIAASFGVLYGSDRQPIEAWKWQPAVYLAILVAIADKAIQFAAFQGAIVAWWYSAAQGTTYSRMHHQWATSIRFLPAILAGRRMTIAALACIVTALFGINGPLLQRATSVDQLVLDIAETLAVNIAPQVPTNATGTITVQNSSFFNRMRTGYSFPATNPNFFPVISDQLNEIPISDGISGCTGRCSASVLAPALTIDYVNAKTFPVNYSKPYTKSQVSAWEDGNIIEDYLAVDIELTAIAGTPETVVLKIGIPDQAAATTGVGNYVLTFYHLSPVTASYEVEIERDQINFASSPSYPDVVARANNTDTSYDTDILIQEGVHNVSSTLSGLAWGGLINFYAFASVVPGSNDTGGTPSLMSTGSFVEILQHQRNYPAFYNGSAPGPLMEDPKDSILAWLNQVMFRTGVWAAQTYSESELKSLMDPGLEVRSNVTAKRIDAQSVYVTDYNYFAAAVVLEVLTVILVLANFYGFWTLDRRVSMSPLEIAKAFDAPLLRNEDCNSTGRDIARAMGNRRVRYAFGGAPSSGASPTYMPTYKAFVEPEQDIKT